MPRYNINININHKKRLFNKPNKKLSVQESKNNTLITKWGRANESNIYTTIFLSFVLICTPIILGYIHLINNPFSKKYFNMHIGDGSYEQIGGTYRQVRDGSYLQVFMNVIIWILFQIILFCLPDMLTGIIPKYIGGINNGHETPTGKILKYNINGLQSWIITHILFYVLSIKLKLFEPSIIANHFTEIFVSANIIGYTLSILVYYKAYNYSSFPESNKFTGNKLYDFVMGVEHNPRIFGHDLKLFFNGRVGINAWTLINISFATLQYEKYGYVTKSMILINLLQALYVIDFFWNERWYLKTIDIALDHFGFYLAWGDCVWLPFFYTLQSGYLCRDPVQLNWVEFTIILSLGIIGYLIFRIANQQKDHFKTTKNPLLFGKKMRYIKATYKTEDGKKHNSKLLCDGMWKFARHTNYTGDLLLSLSYGLACGFNSFIPYYFLIFMTILLVLRCHRDEHKCLNKYGRAWKFYCKKVPYRLIPYVY